MHVQTCAHCRNASKAVYMLGEIRVIMWRLFCVCVDVVYVMTLQTVKLFSIISVRLCMSTHIYWPNSISVENKMFFQKKKLLVFCEKKFTSILKVIVMSHSRLMHGRTNVILVKNDIKPGMIKFKMLSFGMI